MSITTQESKSKRRWFQIGVRTLLIAAFVSTMVFGSWLFVMRKRAQANRERVFAVEQTVAAIEALSDDVKGNLVERRSRTWLEELFNDPGGADDPVDVLRIEKFVSPAGLAAKQKAKQKAHLHNKAVINASVERYYVTTGQWPSNDLNEMTPPTTYDYFPDGLPTNPIDGSVYTIHEETHRVP